ncbi:hypothetical protein D3C78_1808680 [compost metagenome]
MAIGDGATQHVEFFHIHLTDRLLTPQLLLGKLGAGEHFQVGQRLRRKGFVHIDQGQVGQGNTSTIQRQRGGIGRTEQHIFPHINGGKGEAAQVA